MEHAPTWAEIVLLIGALTNTLGIVGALLISLRNGRKVDEIKVATDGMKDELVAEVRSSAHAKGMKAEKDSHRPHRGKP